MIGGNLVQIVARQHHFFRKEILIPAAADDPVAVRYIPLCDVVFGTPDHLFPIFAALQDDVVLDDAVVQQVHVTVVDPRDNAAAFHVVDLCGVGPLRKDFFVAADERDFIALDPDRLRVRTVLVHRVHTSVKQDDIHVEPPFRCMVIIVFVNC